MSTTIKFTNEFGYEISTQQVENISTYSKIFYENNLPVKEEIYNNNNLVNTTYFISTLQQIGDILLISPTISFEYTYFENTYKIVESLDYNNGILIDQSTSVYDINNNTLCFRDYKVENGVAVLFRTTKYYIDDSGNRKYSFDYNSDGTCFMISDEQNYQSDIYAWGIGDPDYTDFTWTGFEYYQFAEPLIPLN